MIKDVCYSEFNCPDLEEAKSFLVDFGMVVSREEPSRLFFRGAGKRPYIFIVQQAPESSLVATGYEIDTEENLRAMAKRLGSEVKPIEDNPWGGLRATVTDCDGNLVNLLWGVEQLEPLQMPREDVLMNTNGQVRRKGRLPVFGDVPPPVLNLCHVIHASSNPGRFVEWYKEHLGAYPSDILMGKKKPHLSFLRFPDGKNYVPHHRVGVFQGEGEKPGVQHVCFESLDMDAIFMGHRYLKSKGYKQSWGPLRHNLGGAISDYWYTPFGLQIEHVTDSDMLNDEDETGIHPFNLQGAYQWTTQDLPTEWDDR